jgi:2-amino-4-hydroxy-6-hydroxymethyldihydropteridine diphosphokinase
MSQAMPSGVHAYIGLGANLGDSAATLRTVLTDLSETAGIQGCRCSPFYRSAPVQASGPDFVNAVVLLDTDLPPLALLDVLQALELSHSRERPYKNAPRTLDLDLLLYGDIQMQTRRLSLPHPRMHERAFVLQPLHDLAPHLQLQQGEISALLAQHRDQAIEPMRDDV